MSAGSQRAKVLAGLVVVWLVLAAVFAWDLLGRSSPLPVIPLVDPQFTNTATVRLSIAEQIRRGTDPSDFDCYACHDRKKPPELRFDANHNLVLPKEHDDIVMRHGTHNRNNLCFNCHNEANLELLQTRDGRELKLAESAPLCGSCHGPTYRDWDAGAHGRTSGYWDRSLGSFQRQICVSCHNPHAPAFPPQKPGPGPHPLHAASHPNTRTEATH
jgi:uncharacterized CHY-type Zn-finger protein